MINSLNEFLTTWALTSTNFHWVSSIFDFLLNMTIPFFVVIPFLVFVFQGKFDLKRTTITYALFILLSIPIFYFANTTKNARAEAVHNWRVQTYSLDQNSPFPMEKQIKLTLFNNYSCIKNAEKVIEINSGIAKKINVEEIGSCRKKIAEIDCKEKVLKDCLDNIEGNLPEIVQNAADKNSSIVIK